MATCPCGSPARPGRKRCFQCARHYASLTRKQYEDFRARRICWKCRKPMTDGETTCMHRACLDALNTQRKAKEASAERKR